jgi:lysophospholipase L1-like esterase
MVAWSGKGVSRNYHVGDLETLPILYERVIPTDTASPRAPLTPAPDAVVVNLGTNDFFLGVPARDAFVASYRELLARLRVRYPQAWLVLAVGPMLADDFPQPNARSLAREWIGSVRDTLRAAGDSRVDSIELWFDPAEGAGCDFHPNVKTHMRLGRELAALIRERLSW